MVRTILVRSALGLQAILNGNPLNRLTSKEIAFIFFSSLNLSKQAARSNDMADRSALEMSSWEIAARTAGCFELGKNDAMIWANSLPSSDA